jgi:hypothetical protein
MVVEIESEQSDGENEEIADDNQFQLIKQEKGREKGERRKERRKRNQKRGKKEEVRKRECLRGLWRRKYK